MTNVLATVRYQLYCVLHSKNCSAEVYFKYKVRHRRSYKWQLMQRFTATDLNVERIHLKWNAFNWHILTLYDGNQCTSKSNLSNHFNFNEWNWHLIKLEYTSCTEIVEFHAVFSTAFTIDKAYYSIMYETWTMPLSISWKMSSF